MNDYEKLKQLLFEEERHKIDELELLLQKSIKENADAAIIIEKISPLLSDIFSKTIEKNKAEFVAIFAPLISLAIKDQVKNEKDDIVDALYPVIGNMISKFVSQSFKDMINEINTKVQSTFSYETLKRKIVAKIKGVSETELLLQSSQKLNKVESVFLIHKESGLLVSERSIENHESIEPEMVASMLSAIRSFVNDWISKNSDSLELNEIEFGNYTIYLEVAGCCYLAVVLSGTSNRTLQNKITSVLEFLVKKHSDAIANFEGDKAKLDLDEINKHLDTLLENESEEPAEQKQKQSYTFFWIIGVFVFTALSVYFYISYSNQTLQEKIEQSLHENPHFNLYDISIDVGYNKVVVRGKLPYESLHKILLQNIKPFLTRRVLEDKIVLAYAPLTKEEINKELAIAFAMLNIEDGNKIRYKLHDNTVTIHGIIKNKKSYDEVLSQISSIEGIRQIVSDVEYDFSQNGLKIYYGVSRSKLTQEKMKLLDLWIKSSKVRKTLELYNDLNLLVMGFSDGRGALQKNIYYAQERARKVYKYLMKKGIPSSRINFIASPTPLSEMANEKNHEGRLVQIKWIKNDN
ncbi:OmpA family protein [Sulfurimonas sp. SWIR-19]|uniref:OmpA family protein n=1 Tax=Sulfurimonas sp. SWIR-19 TaxID=2878390 RepID=UPI001CF11C3C|nr:OmpA family protein [Sulfurimonas sp. SWIR-19]UCN01186.1 OmpA family protein [Sulfurimonas sp. SWIR-19]